MTDRDDSRARGAVDAELVAEVDRDIDRATEPPVVARLIVEVRSDGSRTIARGAIEDAESGQSVAVEARGDSAAQLAWSLAKMIASAPMLARSTARALRPARPRRRRSRLARLVRRLSDWRG